LDESHNTLHIHGGGGEGSRLYLTFITIQFS
jgi:hypothetical protein